MGKLKEIAHKVIEQDIAISDVLSSKKISIEEILLILGYAVKKYTGQELTEKELIKVWEEIVLMDNTFATLEEFIYKLAGKDSVVAIARVNPNVDKDLLEEADVVYCTKETLASREETIRVIDRKNIPEGFNRVWLVKKEKRDKIEELISFLLRAADWRKTHFSIAIPYLRVRILDYTEFPNVNVFVNNYRVEITIPYFNEIKKLLEEFSVNYIKGLIAFGEEIATKPLILDGIGEIHIRGSKISVGVLSKTLKSYNKQVCEEVLKTYTLDPQIVLKQKTVQAMQKISI